MTSGDDPLWCQHSWSWNTQSFITSALLCCCWNSDKKWNEISQHSPQVEIRCPKQPYGWPATQSLQDGTTPVASSIHNPATSPHSSRRESPSVTRSKGARGEKVTAPLLKRKREAADRPIRNNIPPTAVEGAVEGTVDAEICGNGPWGPSCEDEHGAGKASADKLMLVLRVSFIIRELKHAMFLSHGRQLEVNVSLARTVVSSRFSN